jgi:hypothetical protein
MTLPNGMNLRCPDTRIPADQRQLERQRGSSDDPIRHVGNFSPADKLDRIHNGAIHRYEVGRFFGIIQRGDQALTRRNRQPVLLHKIGKFDKANRRNVDGFASLRCGVQGFHCILRKFWILYEVPEDDVCIDDYRSHQNSRGKFFHISRRASSISSAEMEIPRSAQRPLTLLNGFLGDDSLRSWVACASSSCCFSGDSDRTASIKDCSSVIIGFYPIMLPSLSLRKGDPWSR